MNVRVPLAVIVVLGLVSVPCAAQPLIQAPPAETHRFDSKAVGDAFEIRVMLPPMIQGETTRFPVVYMTDVNGGFPVSDDLLRLLMMSDVPRFIAVGIGYPAARHFFQTGTIRQRDLTQVAVPPGRPSPFAGHIAPSVTSGGSATFLEFVQSELMPFIDARYPTNPSDRAYFGHSLGGLFGLYTLVTRPNTFTRYIIGSPSIWWGGEDLFKIATQYMESHDDLPATVFMGIGALEEAPTSRMLTNTLKLETMLRAKKYRGLQLTTRIFADEGHVTVYGMNLTRGLVSVFGRPAPGEDVMSRFRALGK
jgi:predicted alpha/beta superfamily hydrolase